MAPSRPAVYPDQIGLVLITIAVVAFGAYVILRAF
jgi:hypothetical protein